jgi:hypothetical protein
MFPALSAITGSRCPRDNAKSSLMDAVSRNLTLWSGCAHRGACGQARARIKAVPEPGTGSTRVAPGSGLACAVADEVLGSPGSWLTWGVRSKSVNSFCEINHDWIVGTCLSCI